MRHYKDGTRFGVRNLKAPSLYKAKYAVPDCWAIREAKAVNISCRSIAGAGECVIVSFLDRVRIFYLARLIFFFFLLLPILKLLVRAVPKACLTLNLGMY